jgi:hypothetical protein
MVTVVYVSALWLTLAIPAAWLLGRDGIGFVTLALAAVCLLYYYALHANDTDTRPTLRKPEWERPGVASVWYRITDVEGHELPTPPQIEPPKRQLEGPR